MRSPLLHAGSAAIGPKKTSAHGESSSIKSCCILNIFNEEETK